MVAVLPLMGMAVVPCVLLVGMLILLAQEGPARSAAVPGGGISSVLALSGIMLQHACCKWGSGEAAMLQDFGSLLLFLLEAPLVLQLLKGLTDSRMDAFAAGGRHVGRSSEFRNSVKVVAAGDVALLALAAAESLFCCCACMRIT